MTGFTQITVVPPLDFTNEQLVVGDTSAHVSKMNTYMAKIQLWANDFAASIESMNALGVELASAETSNTMAITTLQTEIAEKLDSANTALNQMSEIAEAIVSLQSNFSNLGINDVSDLSNQLNAANQEILSEVTTRASAILAEATSRAYAINLEKVARENADGIESDARIEADNALSARLQIIEDIEQLDEGAVSQALADVNALLAQLGPSPSIQNVAGLQEALDAKVERASLNLDAILLAKDIDPVDIFIYDTKNDSDGGAWRFRTHGTSWFNEPLNTATRGSRREFPSVAIIVAEWGAITILDGDDPELPMWMVFYRAGTWGGSLELSTFNLLGDGGVVMKGAAFNSGLLAVASSSGVREICFISDSAKYRSETSNTLGTYRGGIAERSNGKSFSTSTSIQPIVNKTVNSVATTVLPDAPIDHATGLPVVTIVVDTDGGVSIINGAAGAGTVVNSASTGTKGACAIYNGTQLIYSEKVDDIVNVVDISTITASGWTQRLRISDGGGSPDLLTADGLPLGINKRVVGMRDSFVMAGNMLTLVHDNPSDSAKSLSAAITSKYNTGWQVGDNKLTAMCSTDTSDLVASVNLIGDGTFDIGVSEWRTLTSASSNISHDSGKLRLQKTASGWATFAQVSSSNLVVGQTYTVSLDVDATNSTDSGAITEVGIFSANTSTYPISVSPASSETVSYSFVAKTIDDVILIRMRSNSTTAYVLIDNVSIQLADEDRSISSNGLVVHGIINRTKLHPDSEIVFYKGMSAVNYFTQAFNADLDFGTGDFSISCWVDFNSTGYGAILHRTNDTSSAQQGLSFYYYDGGIVLNINSVSVNTNYRPNGPALITAVRTSGIVRVYINNILYGTQTISGTATISDAVTLIGGYYSSGVVVGRPEDGFALIRFSGTALSENQIKKMYHDELKMITGKATLYGTSDAVNAIAHDKVTGLLHVGTSDGRSSFDGLARVDNTTAAVSVISAHNSLILEG